MAFSSLLAIEIFSVDLEANIHHLTDVCIGIDRMLDSLGDLFQDIEEFLFFSHLPSV